jgi:DNA-binding MarR family transcriptional regulator
MTETDSPIDHVARLIAQRRRETPHIPLEGMEILARARRLDRMSRIWIDAVFKKHKLEAGEFDVLASLQRSGPPYSLRPTELYRSLMITSGGLTDRINRLTRKELVRRSVGEIDARSLLVQLTPLGLQTIRAAFEDDMRAESELLGALNPEEQRALSALLAKLLLSLERRPEAPGYEEAQEAAPAS